jgi:F-type H+-transporting ATPase subunit beta
MNEIHNCSTGPILKTQKEKLHYGKIISIRGSIVDVKFETNLPFINSVLRTGKKMEIILEVQLQLDAKHVRAIALTPTQGLARGMEVQSEGKELTVPVGKEILGRMFDVFGNTIDHKEALPEMERRGIHQSPPPLVKQSTKSEVLKQALKRLMYSCHWNVAARPVCSAEPE